MAIPANYNAIFENVMPPNGYTGGQITNFLEVFLLLQGARKGVLINLDPSKIPTLLRSLNAFKINVCNYREAAVKTLFLLTKSQCFGKSFTHLTIGSELGYLTPLNISKARNGKEFATSIHVNVDYNGKLYTVRKNGLNRFLRAI